MPRKPVTIATARRSDAMQNSRAEVGKTAELFGPAKIVPDPWV